jgi:hypothetical protein
MTKVYWFVNPADVSDVIGVKASSLKRAKVKIAYALSVARKQLHATHAPWLDSPMHKS